MVRLGKIDGGYIGSSEDYAKEKLSNGFHRGNIQSYQTACRTQKVFIHSVTSFQC